MLGEAWRRRRQDTLTRLVAKKSGCHKFLILTVVAPCLANGHWPLPLIPSIQYCKLATAMRLNIDIWHEIIGYFEYPEDEPTLRSLAVTSKMTSLWTSYGGMVKTF